MTLRRKLAKLLDPKLYSSVGLSIVNKLIVFTILLSLLFAIIETEKGIYLAHKQLFFVTEIIFSILFTIEYVIRVWVSIENPLYKSRWHYMLQPASLLDLFAVLLIVFTAFSTQAYLMRFARLLRILRIAKLGRYSLAMQVIGKAIYSRRFELIVSSVIGLFALIISSSLLYVVERDLQPDYFGSIPRAMWWSIITLTTVGYGDVYPVTPLGKFLGAVTAILGIGLIAMPTGILAASFGEAMQSIKKMNKKNK